MKDVLQYIFYAKSLNWYCLTMSSIYAEAIERTSLIPRYDNTFVNPYFGYELLDVLEDGHEIEDEVIAC